MLTHYKSVPGPRAAPILRRILTTHADSAPTRPRMSRLSSLKALGAAAPPPQPVLFATLIRTHHITSRRKLQRVREAAARHAIPYVLVRYGGAPGAMYAEGPDAAALAAWVAAVRALRYKDFHWARRPSAEVAPGPPEKEGQAQASRTEKKRQARAAAPPFNEVGSLAEFAQVMQQRGRLAWWRTGMGFPERSRAD